MWKQQHDRSISWLGIGIIGVFLFSVALRFWGLGRFNSLVFDEVYYAKFANELLQGKYVFYSHPPVGHYFVAIGIWIGDRLPFGKDTANWLTGSLHSTFSYRWMNAIVGSFVPLLVAAIAYQLSRRASYALIASLFVAADGLLLVESRYALNNMYLVAFGLLGQFCFLLALNRQGIKRWVWLAIAGVSFGASICVKWNGLWFLLGAWGIWVAAWTIWVVTGLMDWWRSRGEEREERERRREGERAENSEFPSRSVFQGDTSNSKYFHNPLSKLVQLNVFQMVGNLGIIPAVIYGVLWIPYLLVETDSKLSLWDNFWEEQTKILDYHQGIKDGPNVHPYCSKWFTWPLMLRPIAYFYEVARHTTDPVPAYPPLPANAGRVIYDVHAMGNPILYLLSTAAVLMSIWLLAKHLVRGSGWKFAPTPAIWILFYLVLNYAANFLPWVRVTRCTFLYHYMGASIFAALVLAWFVDNWLHSFSADLRGIGVTAIFVVVVAFVYWLPIYLGLPLSTDGYKMRMLRVTIEDLPSWLQFVQLQPWLPNWV
jgi:dolichyl-phosphate-mannose--protein O-mannosyl transferase